jgi:hypothetical protein
MTRPTTHCIFCEIACYRFHPVLKPDESVKIYCRHFAHDIIITQDNGNVLPDLEIDLKQDENE